MRRVGIRFEVQSSLRGLGKSRARLGLLQTQHGVIETPAFVPVGTHGTLKCLDPVLRARVSERPPGLMFVNSFHVFLHPGVERIARLGGLHGFTKHAGPIMTDSGGFQVYSLGNRPDHATAEARELKGARPSPRALLKVNEDGALFLSYYDGAHKMLSPEISAEIQHGLQSDIAMPFDELLPMNVTPERLRESFDRTHRWQRRSWDKHCSLEAESPTGQAMYGIVHGGLDLALREESLQFCTSVGFDGIAIGGSLGRTRDDLVALLNSMAPSLESASSSLPVHLLGIGDPWSIARCVHFGIDTFDSCYPTRLARHGTLLVTNPAPDALPEAWLKTTSATRETFVAVDEAGPIDPNCRCLACVSYSRGYIQHLFKAREPSGAILATIHNLAAMESFMEKLRQHLRRNAAI